MATAGGAICWGCMQGGRAGWRGPKPSGSGGPWGGEQDSHRGTAGGPQNWHYLFPEHRGPPLTLAPWTLDN